MPPSLGPYYISNRNMVRTPIRRESVPFGPASLEPPKGHVAAPTHPFSTCSIPTPGGRRTLPVPRMRTSHAHPSRQVLLHSALPEPEPGVEARQLRLGVSADMFEAVYGHFQLRALDAVEQLGSELSHVRGYLSTLPSATGIDVQAMQLYVDGSFITRHRPEVPPKLDGACVSSCLNEDVGRLRALHPGASLRRPTIMLLVRQSVPLLSRS